MSVLKRPLTTKKGGKMANEGLVRDPLLKMFHNPGGDWHPGRGDNPRYTVHFLEFPLLERASP